MTDLSDAEKRWQQALAAWAIPEPIRVQAPEDPWVLPVGLFEVHDTDVRTPSHQRALEALTPGDDVLDVGAGRCAMSLPLRPPARRIVAVDGSAEMLDRSPADVTVLGRWPDVAPDVDRAAVVVCGHVLYNVPDLGPFVSALNAAAGKRVVVEITQAHPRARAIERTLWRHFWELERPTGPTWKEAVAVMRQSGIDPKIQLWQSDERSGSADLQDLVSWMRRTVCLDASRDADVRTILLQDAVQRDGRWRLSAEPRSLATIWWDVAHS